jgi:hypothetical protein
VQPLAQRLLRDEHVELRDHRRVAAGGEIGVDRHLDRVQSQLVQTPDLRRSERLVGQIGQRLAKPERQRLARLSLERLLEPNRVDGVFRKLQLVAAAPRDDPRPVLPQRPAQVRDVGLHHLRRGRRRLFAPQPLGEAIRRDGLPRLQRQHGEHRPLLAGAELDGPVPEANLERP